MPPLRFTVKTTSVRQVFAEAKAEVAQHNTAVTRNVGGHVVQAWKDQVEAAFDNPQKLMNTIKRRDYPAGGRASMGPAVLIWSKSPKLMDAYDRGVTIRAHGKRWLAIPADAAGKRAPRAAASGFSRGGRWEKITPAGYERRTGLKLRFVMGGKSVYHTGRRIQFGLRPSQPGKFAMLVVDQAAMTRRGLAVPYRKKGRYSRTYGPEGQTIVVFILVPQVRVKKRLNLDDLVQLAANLWPVLAAL